MTPLELGENDACLAIAQEVGAEKSPAPAGTYAAGWVAGATEIERRILARQERLEPDPFTRCLYLGCHEEALGAFCKGHTESLSRGVRFLLAQAIVDNDAVAYRALVAEVRKFLTDRTVT